MGTSCTQCNKEMHTYYLEGVAVQLCMDCKGVFLSERKLAIIEDCHEMHDSKDALPQRRRTDKKACPHCLSNMKKVRHGLTRNVYIDFCDTCHGIWLEKGVLSSIEALYDSVEEQHQHVHLRVA